MTAGIYSSQGGVSTGNAGQEPGQHLHIKFSKIKQQSTSSNSKQQSVMLMSELTAACA